MAGPYHRLGWRSAGPRQESFWQAQRAEKTASPARSRILCPAPPLARYRCGSSFGKDACAPSAGVSTASDVHIRRLPGVVGPFPLPVLMSLVALDDPSEWCNIAQSVA